ncbi:diaminohydroxyphosphoribosylaminopyrimidine deaminase [Spirosomataceae bacterium TFI 002]|nr:diaminohydroxyphosphoribosylaminopyrimidine deaminase [Spirosomataceae bacterium TFI 002]
MNQTQFMQRALELAALGKEHASPNPMVGCVIVHNDLIIGEGYHQKHGEAHAEVNAINAVENKSLLSESTVYVTLEPCAHFGKTPPCADLLIKHQVAKVVICNRDPFDQVDGKGISKLENAGIKVEIGLLDHEGLELNKHFFTSIKEQRPYIILKWAETADGFVAQQDGKPVAISNKYSQVQNHKWRSEIDAIMVGEQTVKNDNPTLTTRSWKGKNAKRIILDRRLTSPTNSHIFDQQVETIIFNQKESKKDGKTEWIKISFEKENLISQILDELNKRKVRSLLVEGGPRLHQLFAEQDCYDEVRVIKSPKLLANGLRAIQIPLNLKTLNKQKIMEDEIIVFSK